MKKIKTILLLFAMVAMTHFAQAQETKMVGGAEMYPTKDIVTNAASSKDHTTLVAALKAAGLDNTLKGVGPYTVFAPTDHAFEKLPLGTVENLLKPENKKKLTAVLMYHVVPGKLSAQDIKDAIKKGGGSAVFTTAMGGRLWAMMAGDDIMIKDASGSMATITIADVNQSNGVIHVVDAVVLP